jgi:hypothetical protein
MQRTPKNVQQGKKGWNGSYEIRRPWETSKELAKTHSCRLLKGVRSLQLRKCGRNLRRFTKRVCQKSIYIICLKNYIRGSILMERQWMNISRRYWILPIGSTAPAKNWRTFIWPEPWSFLYRRPHRGNWSKSRCSR